MADPANVGKILRENASPKTSLRIGQQVALFGTIAAIADAPPPGDLTIDFGDARGNGMRLKMQLSSAAIVAFDFVPAERHSQEPTPVPPPGPPEAPRPQKPRAVG